METPVQVTFRDMPASDEIEQMCQAEAAKLERYHARITGCRVVIAQPHRHHHKGNLFHVRVDVVVPGGEVVVNREPSEHRQNEKAALAIREAFDTARRQLEDHARRQRGAVKAHETPSHGRVARTFPQEGYGFLTTADGRELYFHRSSVLGDAFERLEAESEVIYHEELGEHGPQASSVSPVGRHSHRL